MTADAKTPTHEAATTQSFEADVSRLLHLMVHSVYSERDIFIRELLSNAADACEKLRYEAIADPALTQDGQPFGITVQQLDTWISDIVPYIQTHASDIGTGFAAAGLGIVHAIEGIFIVIFVTLFALIDGPRMWRWFVRVWPRAARPRLTAAGHAGWRTLTSFIRVQLVVAGTDAIGIGVGAAILGVPLAIPIAVIVFLGAFVPVVGAIVGGIVAVGIALLFNGWVHAVIMLGIVILVQQVESHVLHPLLTGSAVKVHPLGVVLGVATGAALAGIAGAFFAVPFIATANAMIVAAYRTDPDELTGAGHDPGAARERRRRPRE